MSFSIQFSGHISPENPETDAKIRKLARAMADMLRAAGVECTGSVGTPTGGGNLPPTQGLMVCGGDLHVHPDGPGGTPTHH